MTRNLFMAAVLVTAFFSHAACDGDALDNDADAEKNRGTGADDNADSDAGTDTDTDSDSDSDGSVDVGGTITLTDVTDGRIFQRDSDGQYDLTVEGTYSGDPTEIQARVLEDGSDNEVTPWATVDNSPGGGTFSGLLYGIPEGGWYNLEVRILHSSTAIDRGSSRFGVGALIVCAGQSHIDFWFDAAYGDGAPDALDSTRMYRHEQVLQNGVSWTGWEPVTGMGARVFANRVSEALNIPVGLLDYGVKGASLWQEKSFAPAKGWWLPDSSARHPDSDNYSVLKEGLESIDRKVEAVLWVQGHTDAMGAGVTTQKYMTGLNELFGKMRTDTCVPDLPVFISLVTRQAGPPFSGNDANIQAVRNAEEQYAGQDDNAYIGCTTIDLPLRNDRIHHTSAGQKMQAERLAQSVLHLLLDTPPYDYHRGPMIENYQIVDSTTIDLHLKHSGGTDFTPDTDIRGFSIQGDGVGDIVSATRRDATTIRIVISGDTGAVTAVRYLYGGNPGSLNLTTYAAEYVHDNSGLQLPLEGKADVPE